MKEGYFKITTEGKVQQTYHLIDSLGNTDLYGSTLEQASIEADDRNVSEGCVVWFVIPDDPID